MCNLLSCYNPMSIYNHRESIMSSFITIMRITELYYGTVIHIFITIIAIAMQTITITKALVTWCS